MVSLNIFPFQVVIGERFVVPAHSKVSLLQQPTVHDSDEELEYADNSSGTVEFSCMSVCFDLLLFTFIEMFLYYCQNEASV